MVIELRFIEEWSHDKVAEILGKTVDATRALQYRALTSLRQLLKEHEE
jgi:DNA-directed RNA polymerase specialized sigma24 family protein